MPFCHVSKRCEVVTVVSRFRYVQSRDRYGGVLACVFPVVNAFEVVAAKSRDPNERIRWLS